MEPMTLGSPGGSPSQSINNCLPSILMGDPNVQMTPRNNTLSPTKGRTLAFAQSPILPTTPTDFGSRSMVGQQKSMFAYQQTPQPNSYSSAAPLSHNLSVSGPPTQDLFDSLRAERNAVESPSLIRHFGQTSLLNQSTNDSYMNQSDFYSPRFQSPPPMFDGNMPSPRQPPANFWVTIFGFPPTATSAIIANFSQCGTIVDKIFAPHNGNWIHLKFASRLECDKALNYHERIIGGNLMIGVTYCKDANVVDKENLDGSYQIPTNRVRPLAHIAYKNAQSPSDVVASPTAPKRSTGLVNKAMDLFFGW